MSPFEPPPDPPWVPGDENGEPDSPQQEFVLENEDGTNATPWLVTFVRANMAEHFSQLYDNTPAGVIDTVVHLALAGLNQLSQEAGDPPDAEGAGT